MKVALVASAVTPGSSSLERHVLALAHGLAEQGVEVEVVTQDTALRAARAVEQNGLVVRRFPATSHGLRLAAAPGLREQIRQVADSSDVVHIHASRGPLAAAAAGLISRQVVFTPHAPIQRLMRWPHAPGVRAVVDQAACILPLSNVEADLISEIFPHAAARVRTVPPGVDDGAVEAARPLPYEGKVLLAAGGQDGEGRPERVIAAMASLDEPFRLVVLADRPAIRRLERYADDLRVSERVAFIGRAGAAVRYRWLRTARVVVALREREPSGLELLEALSAGSPVVASDSAVNREAARFTAGAGVEFVSPECSPLELADAIAAAAELSVAPAVRISIPSARAVAEHTLSLYRSISVAAVGPRGASANGRHAR